MRYIARGLAVSLMDAKYNIGAGKLFGEMLDNPGFAAYTGIGSQIAKPVRNKSETLVSFLTESPNCVILR